MDEELSKGDQRRSTSQAKSDQVLDESNAGSQSPVQDPCKQAKPSVQQSLSLPLQVSKTKCRSEVEPYRSLYGLSPRQRTTQHSSNFFASSKQEKTSSVKFPSLDAPCFGLAQEQYADDPFQLLIVVLFLNKTKGVVSIPLCEKLFELYPTPLAFAEANLKELTTLIRPLGLQEKRAKYLINLGRAWLQNPPQKSKRYRRLHYPTIGDGKDVPADEAISDDDPRTAWEIAHLPTVGEYALDSWRIFCRDKLRGLTTGLGDLTSLVSTRNERKQEWASVLPKDKELRAYVKWRWMRLGYLWDPLTGWKAQVGLDVIRKMERKEFASFNGYQDPWTSRTPAHPSVLAASTNRIESDRKSITAEEQLIAESQQSMAHASPSDIGDAQSPKVSQASSLEDKKVVDEVISMLKRDTMIEALRQTATVKEECP